ncbi:esterase [Romboutsia weinsteinii]|uniref:Esterase n=1 Tax=Romboutsia weinsteinii TaxID=2020949 RepID=A0A371J2V3_9FIRM|nr:alpha/beta hydrolase-fold protein [Romboutsia weinsteinii]RDY27109.1 esterase [Romboutsia weinsteinii]
MKIEWFREYSQCLNRDMEFKVYGHAGQPVLVFPAQDGRYYDFENFKMVDTVSDLIEQGRVQLFCCDSIDLETWSANNIDVQRPSYMHEQWYYYITNELVPRIFNINYHGNGGSYARGIITTGCSLGATHAANFMFRRPDIFIGTIALSGYYDTDIFFGEYSDEIIYNNSPIKYIEDMSYDHHYVNMYRNNKIVMCCGQGAWENLMIPSTLRMKELLEYKNIPAWVDIWGYDVNHDWDWWRVQFPYFFKYII